MSNAETLFAAQIEQARLPLPSREYHFLPGRRYRFDFAWYKEKVAMEVEGGSWIQGAHTRGKHFESDCRKYGEAALAGWMVLRVTPAMIEDGTAIEWIRRALNG